MKFFYKSLVLFFLIIFVPLYSQCEDTKITLTIPAYQLSKEILSDDNNPVIYKNVRFIGDIEFQKKEIEVIKPNRISKIIEFSNCIFDGFYAQKCIFDSSFSINNCEIRNNFDFSESIFCDDLQLESNNFEKDVEFKKTEFKKIFNLYKCSFNNVASFYASIFRGNTNLSYSTFYDIALFSGTVFMNDLNVMYIEFQDDAVFEQSIFLGETQFIQSNFNGERTSFNMSNFCGNNIIFNNIRFNSMFNYFYRTNIHKNTNVSFIDSNFEHGLQFAYNHFKSNMTFLRVEFGGRAEFYNFLFDEGSNLSFVKCQINAPINLTTKPDNGNIILLDTLSSKKKKIDYSIIYLSSKPDTIFYTPPLMDYIITRVIVSLDNSNFRHNSTINFIDCVILEGMLDIKFDNIYDREIKISHLGDPEKMELRQIHRMYTQLIKSHKFNGDWDEADDFYYEWKQIERRNFLKDFWKNRNKKLYNPLHLIESVLYNIFNWLNWLSCGYGVKPLWIFPFAFFIVCIFAFFYFFVPQSISNLKDHLISQDKIKKKLQKMKMKELKEKFALYDFEFKTNKQKLIEDITSSIGIDELTKMLNMKSKSRYNFDFFWHCFYFSFSKFSTLGIGDWYPFGNLTKAIVMIEGAIGWLCLGLFIITYANILLR